MNDPHNHQPPSAVSRRAFLKGGGLAAAATALGQAPPALADIKVSSDGALRTPIALGPGAVQVQLSVNGKQMTTKVEPRTTLLDALRDFLDVTGCKRVCDRGSCGACTVLLDGKPIYSCSMLAVEAQGRAIKTAEALAADGQLDPVPAAFVKYDAQQCGFCTPGFVVALRAAFDANPNATPAEIEEALSGNICRCGTYQQMRDAIAALCQNQGKGV